MIGPRTPLERLERSALVLDELTAHGYGLGMPGDWPRTRRRFQKVEARIADIERASRRDTRPGESDHMSVIVDVCRTILAPVRISQLATVLQTIAERDGVDLGPWAQLDPDWRASEHRRRRDRGACRLAIRNAVRAYASRPVAKHLDEGIQALSSLVDLEFPVTSDLRSSSRVARLEQFREATAKAMPRIARVSCTSSLRSLPVAAGTRRASASTWTTGGARGDARPGITGPLWAEVWYAFPEHEDTPVWFVGKPPEEVPQVASNGGSRRRSIRGSSRRRSCDAPRSRCRP